MASFVSMEMNPLKIYLISPVITVVYMYAKIWPFVLYMWKFMPGSTILLLECLSLNLQEVKIILE